jgi:hypothetical protein
MCNPLIVCLNPIVYSYVDPEARDAMATLESEAQSKEVTSRLLQLLASLSEPAGDGEYNGLDLLFTQGAEFTPLLDLLDGKAVVGGQFSDADVTPPVVEMVGGGPPAAASTAGQAAPIEAACAPSISGTSAVAALGGEVFASEEQVPMEEVDTVDHEDPVAMEEVELHHTAADREARAEAADASITNPEVETAAVTAAKEMAAADTAALCATPAAMPVPQVRCTVPDFSTLTHAITLKGAQLSWAVLQGAKIIENRAFRMAPGWCGRPPQTHRAAQLHSRTVPPLHRLRPQFSTRR